MGRHSSKPVGSDDLALACSSRLLFFLFMRLVCLVVFFIHRQACLLGGQTTNRIFNYAADIPPNLAEQVIECYEMTWRSIVRASDIVDVAKHPKKNCHRRVVEFTCFLQPLGKRSAPPLLERTKIFHQFG